MKQLDPHKDNQKKAAAEKAALQVKSGQTIGLGTGSTAAFAIKKLGERKREEGLDIKCVVTSFQTEQLAQSIGLNLVPLSSVARLDISIDGSDEIDSARNLIKGGGAAHTIEKLVHSMSDLFIMVADSSKVVQQLGEKFAVPVEIIPAALSYVTARLQQLNSSEVTLRAALRKDGPVITDNGNFVLDARFEISDPLQLERSINAIAGVVDNGIFAEQGEKPEFAYLAYEDRIEKFNG